MSAMGEVVRTAATLGYFFSVSPLLAVAIFATGRGQDEARMAALAHLRRARRIAGMQLAVAGEEHVPSSGGFVLVFNETSFADFFATVEVLSRHTELNVVANEFAHSPLTRRAVERAGFVFMPRGDRAGTDKVLAALTAFCARGGRVSVAAQGRISPTPGVAHFKRGAFLIAIRAGVPVLPMAVRGGREILAPGSIRLRPGVVHCRFGPPISARGLTDDDAPGLAERARASVAQLYSV
jgi:1-acyl-sn-glycerol-3-phosphate acyltransferase